MIDAIKLKLYNKFSPDYLAVIDESSHHKGHMGYSGDGTVSHIKIIIKAVSLNDLTRIDAHKQIYQALNEIALHAITIEIKK